MAAPEYVQQHPEIRHPDDLATHAYLRFAWAATGDTLDLYGPAGKLNVPIHSRYRINSSLAMRKSFLLSAGVGVSPMWLVQDLIDSGQLVRILPGWCGLPHEAFLIYPSRRNQPLRAKVFMQFITERLAQLPGFCGE